MDQKTLSGWLKCVIIGIALCGIAVYAGIVPSLGRSVRMAYPEFGYCYWPWLVFIWATAIPCIGAVGCAWKCAANIGRDRSFTGENARLLKRISILAAGDGAFFFAGNILFLLLNMSHPGVVLVSLAVVFACAAVSVAAAALSHLAKKAAVLQEQCDLTI